MYINNIVSVEELQDQLEKALMACDYYDVAKAFILYRRKRAESRALNEKKQFIKDYAKARMPQLVVNTMLMLMLPRRTL